jgi:hypothetical protein
MLKIATPTSKLKAYQSGLKVHMFVKAQYDVPIINFQP